jgi:hypothetical protein
MDVQSILVEEGLVGGADSSRLAILVVLPLAVGKVVNGSTMKTLPGPV